MKAWRRAFLYVTRKTGKMVLLLVLFLTIMTLVLVDTAISQASEGTAARLREEIGGYFKVGNRLSEDGHPSDGGSVSDRSGDAD
ncbi:MAG: hypothetical protein ACLS9Q_07220 [[Clostridium] scindens]|uniref:hypothetical protein n=1 Tax=Clostridium scindens (strain JCM 10418 / VPI 12708) TaxID=29347 RepID=UPI0039912D3B